MPFNALTADIFTDMSYARLYQALAASGVRLIPEDIPRINEVLAADPALIEADALAAGEDRNREFRRLVRAAMNTVAQEIRDSGVDRSTVTQAQQSLGTPEPTIWANGTTLQRVSVTALAELDDIAAAESMGDTFSNQLRQIAGLGTLFTEDELSHLMQIPLVSLRAWRKQHQHFEFVKFPGNRGLVRYTERGIRAFIAAHTKTVAPQ